MNPAKTAPAADPARRGRKSWREKLADDKDLPKVITIGPKQRAAWGEGTCAIPSPREIDSLMRRVPRGKVVTTNELRAAVARRHQATIGCPLTTGIFAWIAAHAAEEAAEAGEHAITPYWRTLRKGGELNPKFPGGIPALTVRLEAEGHTVVRQGNRFFILNFEQSLAKL